MKQAAGVYQATVRLLRNFWGEPLNMVAHPSHSLFTEGLIDPCAKYMAG